MRYKSSSRKYPCDPYSVSRRGWSGDAKREAGEEVEYKHAPSGLKGWQCSAGTTRRDQIQSVLNTGAASDSFCAPTSSYSTEFRVGRPGMVTRFSESQMPLKDVLATEPWCELTALEQAIKSPGAAVKIIEFQNVLPVARVQKKKVKFSCATYADRKNLLISQLKPLPMTH